MTFSATSIEYYCQLVWTVDKQWCWCQRQINSFLQHVFLNTFSQGPKWEMYSCMGSRIIKLFTFKMWELTSAGDPFWIPTHYERNHALEAAALQNYWFCAHHAKCMECIWDKLRCHFNEEHKDPIHNIIILASKASGEPPTPPKNPESFAFIAVYFRISIGIQNEISKVKSYWIWSN